MRPISYLGLVSVVSVTACGGGPDVPPGGYPELASVIGEFPAATDHSPDGCLSVHHVWKPQVGVLHAAAHDPSLPIIDGLADSVYTPFQSFWDSYLGRDFRTWARDGFEVPANDSTAAIVGPAFLQMLARATDDVEALTGRRGCSEWYLVFGPGWTNLGGLSDGRMIVDFNGVSDGPAEVRAYLPHEIAHIVTQRPSSDPDRATVLASIVNEGLASYFATHFWDGSMTDAESLGYTEAEWEWAVSHEGEIWERAKGDLASTNRDDLQSYRAAGEHLFPDGPGKIGYFIGYRMIEAYLERNGEGNMASLFDLPVADVLAESGYMQHE